ncbi:filamentous hemagglutinin N-terminal domain-containing protein [Nostoc sp. XA010]|uniref:beta strand repeat-containing protein n=1 Tax=Nostoc sp. XA010 TaxID=2780407 RepID=UPI001E489FEC|nr:filamentous hemagglutinin N-terminal domain-containing protein [Nostoc sp. XA010]MCC5661463.1 filamentous hemagglutinin N-terminal domain-containing protein [Nostoc sp. XA010]
MAICGDRNWRSGLLGVFSIIGVLAHVIFCSENYALAQITPDETLGDNSSTRTPNVNIKGLTADRIDGGVTRGANLFHSFREFNVGESQRVYFANPTGISNILTRVTGSNISNILGTLGVDGGANLFLINPNGILFGKNARLDVAGSFVASTANSFVFGNGLEFSATNPQTPSSLLTVNPSALLFNQLQAGRIENRSIAPAGTDPTGFFNVFGLRVPDGKSLLLVGGNVSMDGGELNAYGGQVELGGLAELGTVALGVNGDNLSLRFPENVARASVSLTNQAAIYVEGAGGGNIAVNASNLEILAGSILSGGIGDGLGTPETVAGDITLNATGSINVAGESIVFNQVRFGSQGNGGNITIDSGSFSLRDRAQLTASTFGQGNAGNVTVQARDAVSLAGNAYIFSTVLAGSVGKGGNININSGSFSLQNGAQLSASTFGQGNAGNVTVQARDAVSLAGNAYIFSAVGARGVGKGGNININAATLSLIDGAQLTAETSGLGNAGNVTVRARDAIFLADNAAILSTVSAGGVGKGGNININAATLSLIDGAQLQTLTRGASATAPAGRGDAGNVNVNVTGSVNIAGEKNGFTSRISSQVETGTVGNGGNITIDSGSFSLGDRARLVASTFGQGNAGNVTVSAKNAVDLANAKILSTVSARGVGKGGNININAATLSLIDGAQLTAETSGLGNAGNVTVRARDAVFLADNAAILSTVSAGGVGKGGNININAATLSLIDGAQLQTLTSEASATAPAGRGDAGNVNVNVTGSVNIAGEKNGFVSAIGSNVLTGTVGNGGNITIDSGSFSLGDRAQLTASTFGQGNAGNVTVSAKNAVELANGYILSTVSAGGVGKGGNIDILAATLSLKDGAQLTALTSGLGNAGNVTVRAQDAVSLADNAAIFSTVSAGGVGKGGNIDILAATLSLKDGAQLQTLTSEASATAPAGRGDAGNVNVKVTGAVDIAGEKNGIFTGILSSVETGTVGNGGNITIDSGSFSLQDRAQLTASTSGQGNAGNVTVQARDAVDLANGNIFSTVSAGGVGKGGNIDILAATLLLKDSAQLLTATREASATAPAGRGDAGNVNVNVTGAVNIAGEKNGSVSGISSQVSMGTVGNGGNITIDSASLSLRDRAGLQASTSGQGNAGNVTVRARDAVDLANGNIFSTVEAGGVGKGGNIDILATTLSLKDGAQLLTLTREASATAPAGRGDAGNVNVNVTGSVNIAGEKNGLFTGILSRVSTGTVGNGGNITIDSASFSLQNGAQLIASTRGQGNAGTIKVNAADFFTISGSSSNVNSGLFVNSQSITGTAGDIIVSSPKVTLDNQGVLNAQSASGNGGNINVNSDLLLLRRNSQISTNAGTEKLGGNGGNININSKFIVAVPNENSDISANAFTGIGGRVDITTNGIFGILPQKSPTEKSDITASSELGVSGEVTINSPDTDPSRGLIQLPSNLVDASQQIAQGCTPTRGQNASRFIATGRGGLPQSPNEPLRGRAVITGWVDLPPQATEKVTDKLAVEITDKEPTNQIVEAQGWIVDANGDVILVAQYAQSSSIPSAISCSQ